MTIIYTDPPSGTFASTYGAGTLSTQNPNWNNNLNGGADRLTIQSAGAGGNVVCSATNGVSCVQWNLSVPTVITGGLWGEIQLANGIGSSAAQEGPAIALSGATTAAMYGYVIRLRFNSGANKWAIFSYNNGTATAVGAETTYTATATDVFALQLVWTDATHNTLTVFQNGVSLGGSVDATNATAIDGRPTFPSGIWTFNGVSGSGDIANARGGTGLYPGLPVTVPALLGQILM